MEMHSATEDKPFHQENQPLRKAALLLTIPCAILPIMMSAAGMMYAGREPVFFRYDGVIFGAVYLLYGYGLVLSWKLHRHWLPPLVFAGHLAALLYFALIDPVEWIGYFTVFSIMVASIINQFFRVGRIDCDTCGIGSCQG
jgi:hypothetical protein